MPHPHVPAFRISAPALRRALVAGMRRVISRRELLNRINVFPVPDGDTGSNLAFTLHSVLQGSLSRRAANASALLRAVASDAIDGARGNSGAILAQFFCGASAEQALERASITVNRTRIPGSYDEMPMGIRLGTPAMTTRGMGPAQAEQAAHLLADVLDEPASDTVARQVREGVEALCGEYPVYT